MTTLFDIGDEIQLTLNGEIKQYTVADDGDCYTIALKNNGEINDGVRIYLDTPALKNAIKV